MCGFRKPYNRELGKKNSLKDSGIDDLIFKAAGSTSTAFARYYYINLLLSNNDNIAPARTIMFIHVCDKSLIFHVQNMLYSNEIWLIESS